MESPSPNTINVIRTLFLPNTQQHKERSPHIFNGTNFQVVRFDFVGRNRREVKREKECEFTAAAAAEHWCLAAK